MKKLFGFIAVVAFTASAAVVFADEPVRAVADAKSDGQTQLCDTTALQAGSEEKPAAVGEVPSTAVNSPAAEKKPAGKETFKEHMKAHYKFYGFIRNYFTYDNRESIAGTADLYYWLPKDVDYNSEGTDMNAQNQFLFLSLTTRVGVDITDYWVGNTKFGGKIEADFYAGLDKKGGVAQLRLRLAYATIDWDKLCPGLDHISMKIGQAWHPLAQDLPDILSLESGAPFNPFNRSPQVMACFSLDSHWTIAASIICQMQYRSTGPEGASFNYMKYACTPETFVGVTYQHPCGFLGRTGVDILSIKPYDTRMVDDPANPGQLMKVNVDDRITTATPFVYLQYTKDKLKLKGKTVYSSAGEHMNLMSGYAICDKSDERNWQYTPLHCSSTWVSAAYGKKVVGALFVGYLENFGTNKEICADASGNGDKNAIFFQPNGFPYLHRMYRIQPEVAWNIGKFQLALEYMMTSVQYANHDNFNRYALSLTDQHWVYDHRLIVMVKFSF